MKIKKQKREDAVIPTASMADIAFLLIIFFMVTTTHEVDRTSVNLPAAVIREKAEQGAAIVVMANVLEAEERSDKVILLSWCCSTVRTRS